MSRRKANPTPSPGPTARRSGLHLVFLALCALGALLSADLLRVHVGVHTDPGYQSYCSVSERLDCAAVAASEYSLFAGLPVALWGLLGYLALAGWAELGRTRPAGSSGPAAKTRPWGMLLGLTALYTALGFALFYVSHFVIHSICLVCAGTYVINVALLAVAFLELRRRDQQALPALGREIGATLARPGFPLIFLAVLTGAVLVLKASIAPYWAIDMEGPGGLTIGRTAEGHPWIGAIEPVVDIVEYSDYQCPHCLRGHNAMRDLVKDHPDRVRLVHRHYPLDQACNPKIAKPFHLYACSYSRLAWCAGEQGRFWEANDYIFQQGKRADRVTPAEVARQLGLNATELTDCERGPAAAREIDRDLKAGRDVGVGGTPTFVLNGQVFVGAIPPEAIAAALAAASPAP